MTSGIHAAFQIPRAVGHSKANIYKGVLWLQLSSVPTKVHVERKNEYK